MRRFDRILQFFRQKQTCLKKFTDFFNFLRKLDTFSANIVWTFYRFKFEPSVISHLSILMSFYFVILFPVNIMNRFTLEQR